METETLQVLSVRTMVCFLLNTSTVRLVAHCALLDLWPSLIHSVSRPNIRMKRGSTITAIVFTTAILEDGLVVTQFQRLAGRICSDLLRMSQFLAKMRSVSPLLLRPSVSTLDR